MRTLIASYEQQWFEIAIFGWFELSMVQITIRSISKEPKLEVYIKEEEVKIKVIMILNFIRMKHVRI